jgi:hypothetical protein
MKTCTRKLYCELTTDELVARGNELAQELTGIVKLELGRARLNAKIKPKKERVEELAVIIDAKKEERDVKCNWYYDYERGQKTLHREDTFELLEDDIIREHERQQHLRFTGEVTPAGYGVTDDELTETDEKARIISSNEEAKEEAPLFSCQNTVCDNFNGDGTYENNCTFFTDDLPNQCKEFTSCDICNGGGMFSDDSPEGQGETYCACRAGVELREQEEALLEEPQKVTPDDCEFCGNKGHLEDDSYCHCERGKWRRDADKSELAARKAAKKINVSGPLPEGEGDDWPVPAPGEAA